MSNAQCMVRRAICLSFFWFTCVQAFLKVVLSVRQSVSIVGPSFSLSVCLSVSQSVTKKLEYQMWMHHILPSGICFISLDLSFDM